MSSRKDVHMSAILERTIQVLGGLNENKQMIAFKFIESLAVEANDDEWLPYSDEEMEEDIRLYDEAKANDDGYRISLEELRERHGF